MTRVILILSIACVALFGSYKNALSYYNEGLYQKALDEAKKSKKNYSNPNLHLIWGYSAQQLGHTEEAMHAFERVLILDANNKQAKVALPQIYRQTDRTELLSEKERGYVYGVSERGMPAELKKKYTLPLKVKTSLALGYNSNANATPGSAVLDTYFDTDSNEEALSSFFLRMTAGINYKYDFGHEDGWYMKTALNALMQSNFSAHLYDLSSVSLEWGAGYEQDNYNLYLPMTYSRINYLDKDLLEHYRFQPTLFIPVNDNFMLNVSILYSESNYIQHEDLTKDDSTWGFSTGGYFLFGDHFAYISAKYENKSPQHAEPSKYIGAKFLTATFGLHYNITPSLLGTIDYRFRHARYDDKVGLTNTIRDDNLHLLDLKLSYKLSEMSEIYISESYTQNLSNYVPSEYKKHNILIGVSVNY